MAGVELIASIIGIAGVGIKLSKTLYQIGYKTANPGHNINRIATNVSLFAAMLKHVGAVLEDAQSLYSPEAVETIQQIIRECEAVFGEIANIVVVAKDKTETPKEPQLANGSKRRIGVVAKVKWYFEGPKAEHMLSQLEYLKTTLSVLMQTLNLAALNAKIKATMGESETTPEIVQQEKLHIETLVVAQQLSVHVMQETQEKLEAEDTRPSTPMDDISDTRYPKLLTQGSTNSLQLVRLSSRDVEFLDRRPSVEKEDGAPLDASMSRSDSFIEGLLSKWTISPEEKFASQKTATSTPQSEEPDREATPVPILIKNRPGSVAPHEEYATPLPDVQVEPPSYKSMSPPPPPKGSSKQLTSTRSDMATIATRPSLGSTGSYEPSIMSSIPSRVTSPRVALERSMTNPEADGLPMLNTFHDHHGLKGPPPAQQFLSLAPPKYTPQPQHRFNSRALAPYMAGAAAASGHRNVHLSPDWSNYRHPYVSDDDSIYPSDSDDSPPGTSHAGKPFTRHRGDSDASRASRASKTRHHAPHDSGVGGDAGDGLDIPWRIRVSPTKYFDFLDNELVGPCTPYLPQESRQWISSHENATTEISKQWVCEEALTEMRYSHTTLNTSQETGSLAGEEGNWRILGPLKFHEIDGLVNRTIQFVEEQKMRKNGGPIPQATPRSAAAPSGQVPQQPMQQPVQMPHMPPMQHRNLSFNDSLPPLHPPSGPPPRGHFPQQQQQTMSPRDMHEAPYSPRDRHGRSEWRDRDHDAEVARAEHKEKRHRRRREKEKEKEREREAEKKKHKGSGMAGTLAKVGTLAVLLEGLDGAF